MKKIESFWSTTFKGTIGIIVVEDEHTFERKVYIGIGEGLNEEFDAASIVVMGCPLPMGSVQRIVRLLRTPKTKRGKAERVKCR